MKNEKLTHIATTCRIEKIATPSECTLLVCIPVELSEGTIGDNKKFVDSEGVEFLQAYDAYLKGEKYGYILGISVDEVLTRGRKILEETMGYSYNDENDKVDDKLIIQNYKEEYVAELESLVYYYDLDELVPVLSCDDEQTFYEENNISIDRNIGALSTKEPKIMLTGRAYANIKPELNVEPINEPELVTQQNENFENKPSLNITRLGLVDYTKKYVIAQDEAVPLIVSAIYNPIALDAPRLKQNILLYGPTGVGKTFILEKIADKLGLPFFYSSVADFSASGYVGNSVDDIYVGLFNAAGKSRERLERGAILFLDEVDKLILSGGGNSDVKSQVYNELLPLYQHGGTVTFKVGDYSPAIQYNKEKLIIVSAGSFARMEKRKNKIGFSQVEIEPPQKHYYTKQDFTKFGVPVEWLGRQDLCIPLSALTEDDLYRILTESLDSPYLVTSETLKARGITLNIPDAALRQMASKAYKLQTGARSLRGIFEFALQDEMNYIVDSIDSGVQGKTTFDVDEKAVVKKLEKYFG